MTMDAPSDETLSPSCIRILTLNCWGLKFISKFRQQRLAEIGRQLAIADEPLEIVVSKSVGPRRITRAFGARRNTSFRTVNSISAGFSAVGWPSCRNGRSRKAACSNIRSTDDRRLFFEAIGMSVKVWPVHECGSDVAQRISQRCFAPTSTHRMKGSRTIHISATERRRHGRLPN